MLSWRVATRCQYSSGGGFSLNQHLGQFSLLVAMSMCLSVGFAIRLPREQGLYRLQHKKSFQKWRPELTFKSDVQKWCLKGMFKSDIQKYAGVSRGRGLWLLLLSLVSGDMSHVTCDTWHVIFSSKKTFLSIFWIISYLCYYPHLARDSVSPKCEIIFLIFACS